MEIYGCPRGNTLCVVNNLRERSFACMDVDLIFKIAGLGILISIIDKVLIQSGRDEQAQMTTLVGVVVVLLVVIQLISRLFESVRTMFQLY